MKNYLQKIFVNPLYAGLFATGLALIVALTNPFEIHNNGQNVALDIMTRLYPYEKIRSQNTSSLIFVDIDDKSLKQLGQWPWPRQITAKLIQRIADSGASAIGIDILMSEQDRFTPESLSQILNIPRATLENSGGINGDQSLALVLNSTPSALAFTFTKNTEKTAFWKNSGSFITINDFEDELVNTDAVLYPIQLFNNSSGAGFINTYKIDGVIRKTPIIAKYQNHIIPSLNLEMFRIALGSKNYQINQNATGTALKINVGNRNLDVLNDGTMIFHHGYSKRFQRISAADLLENTPHNFKSKLVIVGASASSLGDIRSTNLEAEVPGPLFHLQAIDQMLSGRVITQHIALDFLIFILCAFISIASCFLISRASIKYMLIVIPAIMTALSVFAFYSFIQYGFLFNITIAMFILVIGPVTTYIIKSIIEAKLRKKIQSSFAQYVPADIVKRISKGDRLPRLGGEEIESTILFLDIRGYTTLSEKLRNEPELLVKVISLIMNHVTQKLIEKGATIDKYIGDAVMAFWNAPEIQTDHQIRALKAAVSIVKDKTNIQKMVRATSPLLSEVNIDFGIGISTGSVIVGNMGSDFRFNYTVMGDAVNVASRLESLTKEVHQNILACGGLLGTKAEVQLLKENIKVHALGEKPLKGKAEKIFIFGVYD
jgi:adenylate cyclase